MKNEEWREMNDECGMRKERRGLPTRRMHLCTESIDARSVPYNSEQLISEDI
jgi:hypothetical protein